MSHPTSLVKTKHQTGKKNAVISQPTPSSHRLQPLFILGPKKTIRKEFQHSLSSIGAVDLHYHGGFGIDIDTAQPKELDSLATFLGENGVAAFCPTTRSLPKSQLKQTVTTLGSWIRNRPPDSKNTCLPLGIHLEGPFIAKDARGAHQVKSIRPFDFEELETLWTLSRQTLKILTLAPEAMDIHDTLSFHEKRKSVASLTSWCSARKIRLNLGHSRAEEKVAQLFLSKGFTGVTHGWNAMAFHHREPGIMGAALGSKETWIELILDGQHVCPTVLDWTLALHPPQRICFVSDCVSPSPSIRIQNGASRLSDGTLAGGCNPLSHVFNQWLSTHPRLQLERQPIEIQEKTIRRWLPNLTTIPLLSLGLSPDLKQKLLRIGWGFTQI